MRPLALVAILASLVGCRSLSVPYQDKEFKATPKVVRASSGEDREVNEGPAEHAPSDPAGGHMGEGASEEPAFVHTEPVVPTASSFPKTAQPTGQAPKMAVREYANPEKSALRTDDESPAEHESTPEHGAPAHDAATHGEGAHE